MCNSWVTRVKSNYRSMNVHYMTRCSWTFAFIELKALLCWCRDSPVLRPMPRMHRHQLAPSGVKRRAALARRNSLPAGTASHTEDQPATSYCSPHGNCSRAVSLQQAKTSWSTPHGGCSRDVNEARMLREWERDQISSVFTLLIQFFGLWEKRRDICLQAFTFVLKSSYCISFCLSFLVLFHFFLLLLLSNVCT